MLPYLIVGGIALGASILAAIFDEDTEEERRQQEKMREDFGRVESELSRRHKDLEDDRVRRREEAREASIEREERARREAEKEKLQMVRDLTNSFKALAQRRLEEKQALRKEIQATMSECWKNLNDQHSLLRKNALEGLLRELKETSNKVYGYCIFLNKYMKKLEKHASSDMPPEVPFHLPENWLYKGKLVYVKRKSLGERGQIRAEGGYDQNYFLEDIDYIADLEANKEVPLLCCEFRGAPDFETIISAKKGYFKHVITNAPRVGIEAHVITSARKGPVELDFAGAVRMTLPRVYLENPGRIPPPGSSLRVYPLKWDITLSKPILVSEKAGDSYLSCSFDEIPIAFTERQWDDFCGLLAEKSLEDAAGEWKIAPLHENDLPRAGEFKFQLGNHICFSAGIREEGENLHFAFGELLDSENFLQADDIFFVIECGMIGFLESDIGKLPQESFENMRSLYFRALSEFRIQLQIKNSKKGIQYYNRWGELTDRMIVLAAKGNWIEAAYELGVRDGLQENHVLRVSDPVKLMKFVAESLEKNRKATFFIEPEPGRYVPVDVSDDGSAVSVQAEDESLGTWLRSRSSCRIYCRNYAIPENRQAAAIKKFRDGRLANPALQVYALDSAKIVSSRKAETLAQRFVNAAIRDDESQEKAVAEAMAERDIYLIQGPPGTGKTTVIREIIEQELERDANQRILLVSQANVAVDNVLRNFVGKNINFIRCGHKDSKRHQDAIGHQDAINEALREHSFSCLFDQYVESQRRKFEANPDDVLRRYWYDHLIADDRAKSVLGSQYLKNFSLIGATCVGMANPSIGLEREAFDLVIVDEAGKATPGELLIPYIHAKKAILIGDHRQLPPTLPPDLDLSDAIAVERSEDDSEESLSSSMFQRIFESCPESNKTMLTTQYRMPAVIGTMISRLFYGGRIINAPSTNECRPIIHWGNGGEDRHIIFFDHEYPELAVGGKSATNEKEAEDAKLVIEKISELYKRPMKIAVITPYKGQKRLLQKKLDAISSPHSIEIDTVDAFQGAEAEIVLFCTTRTSKKTSFFSDERRMNVALSRAKNQLLIFGSLNYFHSYGEGHVLGKIAAYAEENGIIHKFKRRP